MASSFSAWLSSIETKIENAVVTTEADIQIVVAKVQAGLGILESDAVMVLKWLAANAPTIATELEAAFALVGTIPGLAIPASVASAVTAAGAALTAAGQAAASGQNTSGSAALTALGQAVVAGYGAVVTARQSTQQVLSVMTTAPTPVAPTATASG